MTEISKNKIWWVPVINQCWNHHIEIIGDFMINGTQERWKEQGPKYYGQASWVSRCILNSYLSKNTNLCLLWVICRTDIKNIEEKIKTINAQLENYCQQQNLEIINNSNIKKSKLNSSFHSSLNTSLHPFTQVFETGMSNRHLIYTMFKSTYTTLEPKLF